MPSYIFIRSPMSIALTSRTILSIEWPIIMTRNHIRYVLADIRCWIACQGIELLFWHGTASFDERVFPGRARGVEVESVESKKETYQVIIVPMLTCADCAVWSFYESVHLVHHRWR